MENDKKVIFIDGYTTRDIPDSAPLFILGGGSFHVERMIAWLQANKQYADKNGYIPFQTLRSKEKGTRYSTVDMYQVNKAKEGQRNDTAQAQEYAGRYDTKTSPSEDHPEGIQLEEHPFMTEAELASLELSK